jgi:hypothetical protein
MKPEVSAKVDRDVAALEFTNRRDDHAKPL